MNSISAYARFGHHFTPAVVTGDDRIFSIRTEGMDLELVRVDPTTRESQSWGSIPEIRAVHDMVAASGRVYVTRRSPGGIDLYTADGRERVVQGDGWFYPWDAHPEHGLFYLYNPGNGWRLCRVDSETEPETVFEYPSPVPKIGAGVSPDGEYLAATIVEEHRHPITGPSRVRVMDPDGETTVDLGRTEFSARAIDWRPTDNVAQLLVAETRTEVSRAGLFDLNTETVDWIAEGMPAGFLGTDRILVQREGTFAVNSVTSDDTRQLPDHVTLFPVRSHIGPNSVIYRDEGPESSSTLHAHHVETGQTRDVGVLSNEDCPKLYEPVEKSYLTEDGEEAPVLVYRREGMESAPAVVVVNAGPRNRFRPFVQALVSSGYVVVHPANHARQFTEDVHQNYAAAGRWTSRLEYVDGERIAVYGHSHGGYNTLMQVLRYGDVCACGVAWAPPCDLRCDEDDEHGWGWRYRDLRERLDDDQEKWRKINPVQNVGTLDRPLFVIHGTNDQATPVAQSRRFRDAVCDAGSLDLLEYHELAEKGHYPWSPREREHWWRLTVRFLDRELSHCSHSPE